MKAKPQIHFWTEVIERHSIHTRIPNVLALNACRAWMFPANGVFMIFTSDELLSWDSRRHCRELVAKKLEARERALLDYYGRHFRHHLDQIEFTPAERRARTDAAARAREHEF